MQDGGGDGSGDETPAESRGRHLLGLQYVSDMLNSTDVREKVRTIEAFKYMSSGRHDIGMVSLAFRLLVGGFSR